MKDSSISSKAENVRKALQELGDPIKADFLAGFFKTGPGEYAEGDVFLGITVPNQRKIAKQHKDLPLPEIEILLRSPIHEERLTSLFILCDQFEKGDEKVRKSVHQFYLKNLKHVNNWDLVDLSARVLIGDYLLNKDRKILYRLAKSKNLWERRISVLSTYAFIRTKDFKDILRISKELLQDPEDLIHKAVGWMLREVGNRDLRIELGFLDRYAATMPRTMLRYAIEKFPETLKKKYMAAGKAAKAVPKKKRPSKKILYP
ncbi:DNA alkylation repair protein [Leptospira tipperaryensis]|uniref:DNA alkylation repair protein n=1 Tax=Leptospira tipperaryensis TaxID=2564040 RepID=A0A1D7UUI5_9LEPT|nr:DNA alkylation repair protein [Leptospira tipperaryensis]AOP33225.1 DNA alkylation repair protein [Leptospira tipperaryensis]